MGYSFIGIWFSSFAAHAVGLHCVSVAADLYAVVCFILQVIHVRPLSDDDARLLPSDCRHRYKENLLAVHRLAVHPPKRNMLAEQFQPRSMQERTCNSSVGPMQRIRQGPTHRPLLTYLKTCLPAFQLQKEYLD